MKQKINEKSNNNCSIIYEKLKGAKFLTVA